MVRYFLFLLGLVLTMSCARGITPTRGSNTPLDEYEEDVSYLLPTYKEPIKNNNPKKEVEPIKKEVAYVDDNIKVNAVLDKLIENNKNFNNGSGYRIQVFSGNSRTDFENAKSFLYRNFPELELYESYSQPTYRIKAGDFLYYQDAEKYTATLKQRFGTVRILSEKINVKKAINNKQ